MRPQPFSRGRVLSQEGKIPLKSGFNEAPAFQPGKAYGLLEVDFANDRGFNEAPAFQPGKGTCRGHFTGDAGCFNEAPAFQPGKAASWGARKRCRWCFNEAPAFQPGKEAQAPSVLDRMISPLQ